MKKFLLATIGALLVIGMLVGCSQAQAESTAAEPSVSPTEATTSATEATTAAPVETTSATEAEKGEAPDLVYEDYAEQIERYYTAISEQWDEGAYFDHEMSAMVAYYYEGNALDNVGFACIDLDGDDIQELVIGAIQNADMHPVVFEIWTLQDGKPVMLVQSGSRNRYYLQYAEDDEMWSIANEAENGAASHAVYYLYLMEGKLEVMQGIVFDAAADENEPWFMAYDLDWDVSNDSPIDEDTANAVMEANRNIYSALEYIPYSQCK